MIVDCFPFFNELDLLELRLRTLDRAVDRFVLVEAPFTHRGEPKPLYFAEHAARFAPWSERIVPLVYPGPPQPQPWANEFAQRDFLATALAELAPDDVVLVGDCDEIVEPDGLREQAPRGDELVAYDMRCSLLYVNLVRDERWLGTRALCAGSLGRWGSLSAVRRTRAVQCRVVRGGWHLTWLGGAAAARRKLAAIAEAEFDIPYESDPARLEAALASGYDFEGHPLAWHPIEDGFPAPLREDPERWAALVCPPPAATDAHDVAALLHAHGCFAYVPEDAGRVAVVAGEPQGWEQAGRRRFGERFAGVEATAGAFGDLGSAPWLVVDHLELYRPEELLAAAAARGAAVVAFVANARSLATINAVVHGVGFPPGRAYGWSTIQAGAAAAGYAVVRRDRVADTTVFLPRNALHDGVGFAYDGLVFRNLTHDDALDLLARAFVVTLAPAR